MKMLVKTSTFFLQKTNKLFYPKNEIAGLSKLKAIANDTFNVTKCMKFVFLGVEKGYRYFHVFLRCFQKGFELLESGLCVKVLSRKSYYPIVF